MGLKHSTRVIDPEAIMVRNLGLLFKHLQMHSNLLVIDDELLHKHRNPILVEQDDRQNIKP